jgi:2-polyprenyl-3-methyl-5-hydroxy-6-metoxy-1,4-benzoquinol methylase
VLVRAGRRVDGIELDPVAAERASAVCERVVVGDLQHVDPEPLDGPYDLLLFGDTLEHVPDPVAVLPALATTLRPGATLVVSTPNVANWAIRLGLLLGRFRYTDRGILDRTHLRFYTRRTLVEMTEQSGFQVDRVVGTIPVPLLRSEPLCRLAHAVGNLRPSLFAYSFVVTAHLPRGSAA